MRAQFDAGALGEGPIGDARARLRTLRPPRRAMSEIDTACPPLVIHGRDGGVGRPPVPAQPVHRFRQYRAGATERQRRHWRVSLWDTGIAGETGDAHNSGVLLEKW